MPAAVALRFVIENALERVMVPYRVREQLRLRRILLAFLTTSYYY